MRASIADIVAVPGDPALDCHLTGLRLTSVVTPGESDYDSECLLLFDTSRASGWWADSTTGERAEVDTVTDLTITFGIDMQPVTEVI